MKNDENDQLNALKTRINELQGLRNETSPDNRSKINSLNEEINKCYQEIEKINLRIERKTKEEKNKIEKEEKEEKDKIEKQIAGYDIKAFKNPFSETTLKTKRNLLLVCFIGIIVEVYGVPKFGPTESFKFSGLPFELESGSISKIIALVAIYLFASLCTNLWVEMKEWKLTCEQLTMALEDDSGTHIYKKIIEMKGKRHRIFEVIIPISIFSFLVTLLTMKFFIL